MHPGEVTTVIMKFTLPSVPFTVPSSPRATLALEGMGIRPEGVELTMAPKTTLQLTGKVAGTVLRLMEALEDNDDVQNVYSNFDISEEEMASLMEE